MLGPRVRGADGEGVGTAPGCGGGGSSLEGVVEGCVGVSPGWAGMYPSEGAEVVGAGVEVLVGVEV